MWPEAKSSCLRTAAVPRWSFSITISAIRDGCRITWSWRKTTPCMSPPIRVTASRSGPNGPATCVTSPASISACSKTWGSTRRRWLAWVSAAGSRLRWRRCAIMSSPIWCWSTLWYPAYARRDYRPVSNQHARLRQGGLRRSAEVCRFVQGAARRRSVGPVGDQPRDDDPHRVEALHVQPGDAASDQDGDGADAGGVGQAQSRGAAVVRRALSAVDAQGEAGDHRGQPLPGSRKTS